MAVIKLIESISVIGRFVADNTDGKSMWIKQSVFSIIIIFVLDQITEIKI